MYNIILLIILIIIYYFQTIFHILFLVFFLCSLLIIYLGAVTLLMKKNIFDIYFLIKKLIRIIFSLIILFNYNSNVDWITLYSNYIIENGLTDEPVIQEVVGNLELTPNQQYYLKIGVIITAFIMGVVIFYFLNNSFEGPSPSSIESDSESSISEPTVIPPSVRHMEYSNTIPMEVISESTVIPPSVFRGPEVVEYIITDSSEAVLFNEQ